MATRKHGGREERGGWIVPGAHRGERRRKGAHRGERKKGWLRRAIGWILEVTEEPDQTCPVCDKLHYPWCYPPPQYLTFRSWLYTTPSDDYTDDTYWRLPLIPLTDGTNPSTGWI